MNQQEIPKLGTHQFKLWYNLNSGNNYGMVGISKIGVDLNNCLYQSNLAWTYCYDGLIYINGIKKSNCNYLFSDN